MRNYPPGSSRILISSNRGILPTDRRLRYVDLLFSGWPPPPSYLTCPYRPSMEPKWDDVFTSQRQRTRGSPQLENTVTKNGLKLIHDTDGGIIREFAGDGVFDRDLDRQLFRLRYRPAERIRYRADSHR